MLALKATHLLALIALSCASQCDFDDVGVCSACTLGSEYECLEAVDVYCTANNWEPSNCAQHLVGCPFQATRDGPASPCEVDACTLSNVEEDCEAAVQNYCTYELLTSRADDTYVLDPACAQFRALTCSSAQEILDCSGNCISSLFVNDGTCQEELDCEELNFDGGECETPTPTPDPETETETPVPTPTGEDPTDDDDTRVIRGRMRVRGSGQGEFSGRAFKKGLARSVSRNGVVVTEEDIEIELVEEKQSEETVDVDFTIQASIDEVDPLMENLQDSEQIVEDINQVFEEEEVDYEITSVTVSDLTLEENIEDPDEDGSGGGVSGGVIAGVVIGCVAAVGLVGLAAFFFKKSSKKEEGKALSPSQSDSVPVAVMMPAGSDLKPKKTIVDEGL